MSENHILQEYYEISATVKEFDKNLLTVKGWGVTLALAALAWGFKDKNIGMFLVASVSGLSFWLIEGSMKRHQMRFYYRMREIEVIRYKQQQSDKKEESTPRIDSSWSVAGSIYNGKFEGDYVPVIIKGSRKSYQWAWFFPHVMLPHVVSVVIGAILFALGWFEILAKIGIN